MSDLDDRPAVPPLDAGGDERYGFFVAGAILILLGWGVLLLLNLLLHRMAPSSGLAFGPLTVYPGFGPFAWIASALGAVTGLIGLALLQFGRSSPKGPFVLPGQPY